MRRWIAGVLAAALMMFGGTMAEDHVSHWTRNTDIYYHANSRCRGMLNAVPISQTAAQAFGKHACPVCIAGEDDGSDVRAAVRGGTIVLRFSDAWLAQRELTGVFGLSGDSVYRGSEGEALLTEYLHGDAYNVFHEAYLRDGSAEAHARIPYILATGGELVMNRRHIGSTWYVVVRPQVRFDDSWEMYWRINGMNLRMKNGELRTNFDQQTVEDYKEVALERMDSSEPVYTYEADGLEMTVYRALDANVAVIFARDAGADQLSNMELHIGSESVDLSGYMDGRQVVYCCVLTDGELSALQEGAQARLVRVEKINSLVCREMDAGVHRYYSRESGEMLLEIQAEDGTDSLDYNYRVLVDGEAQRFVLQQSGADWLLDMSGCSMIDPQESAPERITPLIWSKNQGVFLAEYCAPGMLETGERALVNGVEYGKRYSLRDQHESWICCLLNQDGGKIGPENSIAFTVYESGEFHMEDAQGRITAVQPIVLSD